MLLVACAVMALFGLAVTGRERRLGFIAASVVGTQLALHVSFALSPLLAGRAQDQTALWAQILFCHHGPHPITAAQVTAARATMGLSHATLPTSAQTPGQAQRFGLWDVVTASPWLLAMLVAHLAAAMVMAWWLRCGEKRAWAVVRRAAESIGMRVQAVATMPPPEAARTIAVPVDDASRRRPQHWWAHDIQRRGPPAIG